MRSQYPFRVQCLGNSRLTVPVRIHLKDAPHYSGFFLDRFQLHTADREPPILTAPGRIFDRDVAVSIAFAARLKTLECAALLSPVYLFAQAY
uniref:Uncharacterized protein n=1 Tax=Paracidobacterium acidisoli TaxID=2303751 RepID=A0A372IMX7_9BACT